MDSDSEPKPRRPLFHVVRRTVEADGETYVEAVSSPICDFCGDGGPTWEYECESFGLQGVPSQFGEGDWASHGSWCACGWCSELIDQHLLSNLLQRNPNAATDAHVLILQGFFDHMTGEKKPFG